MKRHTNAALLLVVLLAYVENVVCVCEVPSGLSFCAGYGINEPCYREEDETWSQLDSRANQANGIAMLVCNFTGCVDELRNTACSNTIRRCDPITQQPMGWCFAACKRFSECGDPDSELKECEGIKCSVDGVTIAYQPYCTDWRFPNNTAIPNNTQSTSTGQTTGNGQHCQQRVVLGQTVFESLGNSPAVVLSGGGPTDSNFTLSVLGFAEMTAGREDFVHFEPLTTQDGFTKTCAVLRTEHNIIHTFNYTKTLSNGAKYSLQYFFYEREDELEVYGYKYNLSAETFKFSFDVSDWPFQHPSNVFQVMLRLDSSHQIVNYSKPDENPFADFSGNLVTTQNTTLNFRFLRLMSLDDQTIRINKTQVIVNPVSVLAGVVKSASFVINLKAFENTLTYDPDFSVLFGGRGNHGPDATEGTNPSEQSAIEDDINGFPTAAAAGIAVGVVAVVALSVGLVLYFKKHPPRSIRRKQFWARYGNTDHSTSNNTDSGVAM